MQVFTAPRGFIFTITFQVTSVLNGEKFSINLSVHIKYIAGFSQGISEQNPCVNP